MASSCGVTVPPLSSTVAVALLHWSAHWTKAGSPADPSLASLPLHPPALGLPCPAPSHLVLLFLLSVSQNSHKQFRGVRSMKELNESAVINAFRSKFEVSRSFDLEDDMEFCPALLTETDLQLS
ncbi:hypothetical protein HYQ46_009659 [Verticillium longisporum]|nr:hypothetical protein HYQ46_009659 [Verticillium longisporum]